VASPWRAARADPARDGAGAALPGDRRPGLWKLIPLVLIGHLWLANGVLEQRTGWGAGDRLPPRIDVAFVRELVAVAPPALAPPPAPPAAPPRLPAVAKVAQPAASAPPLPTAAADDAPPPTEPLTAVAEPPPPLQPPALDLAVATPAPAPPLPEANSASAAAGAAAAAASAASPAQPFDWPPSTRMSYRLQGHYRGPVEGSAQVDWLRQGTHYQVRMETSVGPVLSRRITSDGELTERGLTPRRFDGEQKVLFRAARRWQLRFDTERVVLSDGREVPTLPGAQDEASQFVQLTWLFTTRPERLAVGQSIEVPLAISRKLERWIYDVVGEEELRFPFGLVHAFHVKPRREAQGGDLTAEIWFAPTLQYLPVRILIRQNTESWVDLTLEKPPMQAAQAGAR
jgi:hypothetical protein